MDRLPTNITPEARARRQKSIHGARANVGLSGFKPTEATEARARSYIEGEITLQELVDPRHESGGKP
ncbi:antitoxin VbhA family protein [Dyella sp. ASV21]|uniref:antitoxin VbhA family protein n=1 Tax=Dyella sp. ASV21 TaxID=2795114 RepID=UPI0031B89534